MTSVGPKESPITCEMFRFIKLAGSVPQPTSTRIETKTPIRSTAGSMNEILFAKFGTINCLSEKLIFIMIPVKKFP